MNVASSKYEILYLLFLGYSEHKLAKKNEQGGLLQLSQGLCV